MKRLYLIIYVCAVTIFSLSAQATTLPQGEREGGLSLATVLAAIRDAQTDYTIHFIHNDLEHLRVSARIKDKDARKAVKQACKGLPVKVKTRGQNIFVQYKSEKDLTGKTVNLTGAVEDGFLERPLPHAKVSILRADSSVVVDSAQIVVFFKGDMNPFRAQFNADVSAAEKEYLVRSSMEGYDDVWQRVAIPHPLPEQVEVPTLKMRKSSAKTMRELTVTATKIKMFWRGDTLVYDATAFRLPEGSMLDDLIRQLEGVTMNADGEIFVNGRKVDELLLGSRSFFGGNKKVLLENLPYYTVKNLKVYEKQTDKSMALGYDVEPRRYVMDVNLKDEYSQGYIGNVEAAGGGPSPRSPVKGESLATLDSSQQAGGLPSLTGGVGGGSAMVGLARGFLLGFTDKLRFTLLANANNVNEGRHIGKDDHWTPARQPRSLLTTRSVAGEINYQTKGDALKETFRAEYTSTTDEQTMQQQRDYFISGAALKSATSSFNRMGNRKLNLNNTFSLSKPFYLYAQAGYNYARRDGSFNSAFDQWSDSLTVSQRTVGISEGRAWGAKFDVQGAFNIGPNKQHLDYYFNFSHSNDESESATRYATQAEVRPTVFPSSQSASTTHNSSSLFNRNTSFLSNLGYGWELAKNLNLGISDFFYIRNRHDRDYLYHPSSAPGSLTPDRPTPDLTRPQQRSSASVAQDGLTFSQPDISFATREGGELAGAQLSSDSEALPLTGERGEGLEPGEGLLPSQIDALAAFFDPSNSYDSHDLDWSNNFGINLYSNAYYIHPLAHMKISYQRLALELGTPLSHERLHYQRGSLDTLARQTVFLPKATLRFRNVWKGGQRSINGNIRFEQERTLLLDRINFRDDSKPLVVKLGNPDLKPKAMTSLGFSYYDSTGPKNASYNLAGNFFYHHRDIAQSFTYDPVTGVSIYRPMNVSGAYRAHAEFGTDRTIDEKRYWTWHVNTGADFDHSKDHALLENAHESSVNTVNTLTLNAGGNIRYNRKTLNVRAVGYINWRKSFNPDSELVNTDLSPWSGGSVEAVLDFQYGLEASYTTPALCGTKVGGLTLAADATMFNHRGYGTANLNRHDFVMNASLSQSFLKGKLILSLEAFDLLHQLSPIDYDVNAQGRTITWYRSLPHYVMLHAAWHFNKNPKKK